MSLCLILLLSLLDSDSFRTREAATAALSHLAPLCWQQLYTATGPLETRLRAKLVADRHWLKIPLPDRQAYVSTMRPRGWHFLPWANSGNPYLTSRTSPTGGWAGYREATAIWLADAAETMMPDGIRAELEEMARVELEWIESNLEFYRASGGPRRHH